MGDTGGWPAVEVPFPGYAQQGSRCAIAQVAAEAVGGQNGTALLMREFLLKRRPVLVKGAVKHDRLLRPLLSSLQRYTLLASEWGQRTWEVGTIPYESIFLVKNGDETKQPAPKMKLVDYSSTLDDVGLSPQGTNGDSPAPAELPRYIFSAYSGEFAAGERGRVELFAERPGWFDEGLPGVAEISRASNQFFLGVSAHRAQQAHSKRTAANSPEMTRCTP